MFAVMVDAWPRKLTKNKLDISLMTSHNLSTFATMCVTLNSHQPNKLDLTSYQEVRLLDKN